jgi:hypothetical protein
MLLTTTAATTAAMGRRRKRDVIVEEQDDNMERVERLCQKILPSLASLINCLIVVANI